MTDRALKSLLRQHYKSRALSEDQLERLETLLGDQEAEQASWWQRRPAALLGWSVAAALATLLAVFVLLPPSVVRDVPVTERIALEVARNHIKLKPLDVETNSMDAIRRYFTDLEFVPADSRLLASANLELLGGRYCSIQSVPAAQLRVTVPDSNALQTLYQSEYRKDVFGRLPVLENGDAPISVNVKGISVTIWVERGLLFALTEETRLESIVPLQRPE